MPSITRFIKIAPKECSHIFGVKMVNMVDITKAIVVTGLLPNHSPRNDSGSVDMKQPQKKPPKIRPCWVLVQSYLGPY